MRARTFMLLIFRFLLTMLRSPLRRRVGPFDESIVRFTVLPTDCDLNFHLNAGRFVSFMDIARVELFGRMRIFVRVLRRGWRPVIGGVVVRYRRSILPFERFAIHTRIVGWDAKWFYIEHVVERGGVMCAIAYARAALRTSEGTVPPIDVLHLASAAHLESPPLPEFVERWRAAEDAR